MAIVCSEALMMVTLKKWLKSVTECLHLCTHYFHKKSTNFAADAARTTCTVKNNFFGVPKNKTICAKKKHLDFYNIKIVQVEALCTYCALVTASVLT